MLGAAIAGGAASLIGGLLGNRARRKEAEKNRQFQADMSGSAWQRAVKDMEAAGLNPALAYGQGPASTPGGSMAAQEDVISPAVSSAMAVKRMQADLKAIREDTRAKTAIADREMGTNAALGIHGSDPRDGHGRRVRLDLEGGLASRIQNQIAMEKMQFHLLEAQLPGMRATAQAYSKYPQTALFKLLMESGGGAATGLLGGWGGAAINQLLRKNR
jgi:hypothetical protein